MKEQTPLQRLLSEIVEEIAVTDTLSTEQAKYYRIGLNYGKKLSESLLPEERKVIESACQTGFYCGNDIAKGLTPEYKSSVEYYETKFKQ